MKKSNVALDLRGDNVKEIMEVVPSESNGEPVRQNAAAKISEKELMSLYPGARLNPAAMASLFMHLGTRLRNR